jgi:murein L,D-transpeptidase YcbB/YkuD
MNKNLVRKLVFVLTALILESIVLAISSSGSPDPISERTAGEDQIENVLEEPSPSHPGYLRLKEALAGYRNIAQEGGWPKIPEGPSMKKGQEGERIKLLRWRLEISGEINAQDTDDEDFYDYDLEEAVRKFQRRHGLEPDGVVGPATLAALNVAVEERIRQIEANLRRWQWLPQDLGQRHIIVNVADYKLEVIEAGRRVMEMRVIVGKQYWHTPVFSAIMTHIVFNPYWNVPPRIAKKEMLPRVLQEPGYLLEQSIRIFEGWDFGKPEIEGNRIDWTRITDSHLKYKFRQDPGPKNPLGRIKFVFSNRFNVYLHDTPFPELFNRRKRALSHGCIRVEKPVELAEYILRGNPAWTREKIVSEMKGDSDRVIGLPEGIPLYVLYWTAWVDEDGLVQFRDDVYGRDRRLYDAPEENLQIVDSTSSVSSRYQDVRNQTLDNNPPLLPSSGLRLSSKKGVQCPGGEYREPFHKYADCSSPLRGLQKKEDHLSLKSDSPK